MDMSELLEWLEAIARDDCRDSMKKIPKEEAEAERISMKKLYQEKSGDYTY